MERPVEKLLGGDGVGRGGVGWGIPLVYSRETSPITLSLLQAIMISFANSINPDETAQPSHLDLRCLTFSLSTLDINFFQSDSLFKKADNKCRLKFGTERVNSDAVPNHKHIICPHMKASSTSSAKHHSETHLSTNIVMDKVKGLMAI